MQLSVMCFKVNASVENRLFYAFLTKFSVLSQPIHEMQRYVWKFIFWKLSVNVQKIRNLKFVKQCESKIIAINLLLTKGW